jgi:hypothetical protein
MVRRFASTFITGGAARQTVVFPLDVRQPNNVVRVCRCNSSPGYVIEAAALAAPVPAKAAGRIGPNDAAWRSLG